MFQNFQSVLLGRDASRGRPGLQGLYVLIRQFDRQGHGPLYFRLTRTPPAARARVVIRPAARSPPATLALHWKPAAIPDATPPRGARWTTPAPRRRFRDCERGLRDRKARTDAAGTLRGHPCRNRGPEPWRGHPRFPGRLPLSNRAARGVSHCASHFRWRGAEVRRRLRLPP